MSTRPTPTDLAAPARQEERPADARAQHERDAQPAESTPLAEPVTASTLGSSDTAPKVPPGGSLVGTTFDDYEIRAELGRGGMGIVYKAHQKSLDRLVALKMLLGDHCADPVRLARLLTEARASASLNHPNIVQVYAVGESAFGHYFVMEYIEGQTLESLLKRGKVSISSSIALSIRVAEAVHYAHTRKIIHRDLKPANIMLDAANRVVVMDFGIAKLLGQSAGLTQQGAIMGTPAYMAPEQAGEHHDKVGPHSDVYALGAILYTMLTGRPPYDEGTPLRTVLKVISDEMPPSVRSLRPEVPEIVEKICTKCLSKQPADRYPSAHAFGDHLRRVRTILAQKKNAAASGLSQGVISLQGSVPSVVLVAIATGKPVRLFSPRTVLGRAAECDLILRSSDVSKQHCQILLSAEAVVVEDLDSANGILVNGEPVKRAVLKDGDRLTVARYEFEVRLPKAKT